ncbi:caspase family protein [Nocardia sp. A7]|uniref:caspase family protein n=1 Tax=Nocardia sp. A7 TaxID=2789274 RepID=UPI00397D0B3D
MTHPVSSARASSGLTRDELEALRPHVINLRDGRLAETPVGEGEFFTTAEDVAAIFDEYLPAFVAKNGTRPVPLVLYAHGGLIAEANGLRIAHRQVRWWLDNGAYPIHFIWETGLLEALSDALAGWLSPSTRGWLGDARDRVLETVARVGQGKRLWDAMKDDAEAACADGGGGQFFADVLGTYITAHPGAVTVHLVGHSAGSILHAHLLPTLLDAGVDHVDTISFLAPAVRADLFARNVLPALEDERVRHLTMFTMNQQAELNDTCGDIYGKSLLYLVSASFEPEIGAPILGLQQSVHADRRLDNLFSGASNSVTAVWSSVNAGPRDSSTALSHGAFDDDTTTMDSVARRVLDRDDIVSFPAPRGTQRAAESSVLHTASVAAPLWSNRATRKALCIGVDRYPNTEDRLAGCVADARDWAAAFRGVGFDVAELHDARADRDGILRALVELVSGATAGDELIVQYAGHGTNVDDLDHDESLGGDLGDDRDEALCPVNFRDGELLIDDDLGRVWDLLPDGVVLTLIFDSCHSGSAHRGFTAAEIGGAQDDTPPDTRPRYVALDNDTRAKYRKLRGHASRAVERLDKELLFSACRASELAFETAGHGDFTARAAPLVVASAGSLTNREYLDRILAGFGSRQTPEIHGAPNLYDRKFLIKTVGDLPVAADRIPVPGSGLAATDGDARTLAVAAFLRATADLLDPR